MNEFRTVCHNHQAGKSVVECLSQGLKVKDQDEIELLTIANQFCWNDRWRSRS